jgi:hypothetical protein
MLIRERKANLSFLVTDEARISFIDPLFPVPCSLLVSQRLNWIEPGGALGRIDAEEEADGR